MRYQEGTGPFHVAVGQAMSHKERVGVCVWRERRRVMFASAAHCGKRLLLLQHLNVILDLGVPLIELGIVTEEEEAEHVVAVAVIAPA